MLSFGFLVFFGLGLSFLFWPLVVLPLRMLGLAAFDAIRADHVAAFRLYAPLLFLTIPAISLLVASSFEGLKPNRAAVGQIGLALLGIPGDYKLTWAPGLWIVRGITVALIGSAIWGIARSWRNTRGNGA